MKLKENPTGEDLFNVINDIRKEIEVGEIYGRGQYVGFIKIKDKKYNISVNVESADGLKFFW